MATRINGFGTWNYGRKNVFTTADYCESCGAYSSLSSYDTSTYISALFLPVIPLGKKRILNHCKACGRYKQITHAEWSRLNAAMTEHLTQAVPSRLSDPAAMAGLVNEVCQVQDRDTFDQLAPRIEQAHPQHAGVLQHLAEAHDYFGYETEAIRLYRSALAVEDSKDIRERLAWIYLKRGQPREAAPCLRHVIQDGIEGKSVLLYHLVEAFQVEGAHKEAQTVIDAATKAFPALTQDKQWKRAIKVAAKHGDTARPVGRATLSSPGQSVKQGSGLRTGLLAGGTAVLFAGIYLAIAFASAKGHAVYLVNGLDRPYSVEIDGKTHTLPQNWHVQIALDEGTHTIRSRDIALDESSFELATNFFARPFREDVFVVNPDRVALVLWEDNEYMVEVDDSAKYEYKIATNQLLHAHAGIHFVFEEYPDEIEMEDERTMRTRLSVLNAAPEELIDYFDPESEDEALLQNIRTRFRHSPNSMDYARLLYWLMEEDAFFAEIQEELARSPVHIELHRMYQEVMEATRHDHDLQAEYEARLAEHPDDIGLKYLVARATRPSYDAMTRAKEAAEEGSAHGNGAVAYYYVALGEPDIAAKFIERALEIDPNHPSFLSSQMTIWQAQGEFDPYITRIPRNASGVPDDYDELFSMACAMAGRGDANDAVKRLVNRTARQWTDEGYPIDETELAGLMKAIESRCIYCRGDRAAYLESIADSEEPFDAFQRALIEFRGEDALELAESIELDFYDLACLYLVLSENDMDDMAREYLSQITAILAGASDYETRLVGGVLSGAQSASEYDLFTLAYAPEQKRVCLLLLAERFPGSQQRYLSMARKLNFVPTYPYYFVDAYLERAGY